MSCALADGSGAIGAASDVPVTAAKIRPAAQLDPLPKAPVIRSLVTDTLSPKENF